MLGKRIYDDRCFGCFASGFEGGFGLSKGLIDEHLLTYAFADFSGLYSDGFGPTNTILTLGPKLSAIFYFPLGISLKLDAGAATYLGQSFHRIDEQDLELRKNFELQWSLGAKYLHRSSNNEAQILLYHFF